MNTFASDLFFNYQHTNFDRCLDEQLEHVRLDQYNPANEEARAALLEDAKEFVETLNFFINQDNSMLSNVRDVPTPEELVEDFMNRV